MCCLLFRFLEKFNNAKRGPQNDATAMQVSSMEACSCLNWKVQNSDEDLYEGLVYFYGL